MADHTPGPWTYGPTGSVMQSYSQPFAVGQEGTANLICGTFGDVAGGPDVAVAKARLIAAAPDMLAALRRALFVLESPGIMPLSNGAGTVDVVRAAIAKAGARNEVAQVGD